MENKNFFYSIHSKAFNYGKEKKNVPKKILIQKGGKAHEFVRKRSNQYKCICVEKLNAITSPCLYLLQNCLRTITVNKILHQ